MEQKQVIIKRFGSFNRFLEALRTRPDRKMFQSEAKRLVSSKIWYKVVKRELELWNGILRREFPGYYLADFRPAKNPRTGRNNEILCQLHPDVEVRNASDTYFVAIMRGGRRDE